MSDDLELSSINSYTASSKESTPSPTNVVCFSKISQDFIVLIGSVPVHFCLFAFQTQYILLLNFVVKTQTIVMEIVCFSLVFFFFFFLLIKVELFLFLMLIIIYLIVFLMKGRRNFMKIREFPL